MNVPTTHLGTYLNDHLAGAAAAIEILSSLSEHQDASLRRFSEDLRAAIDEDRLELTRLMRQIEVSPSPLRQSLGWLGEKAAELKLRLDDPSGGTLRTFELLEAITLGIEGKRALWQLLQSLSESIPALRALDYTRLAQRAASQRGSADARRLEWAAIAFAQGPRHP